MTRIASTALLLAIGFVLAIMMLWADPADATPACARHETISRQLERLYSEVSIARGLTHSGQLLQVFETKGGATWTVVLIRPDGIVAAGTYWLTIKPKEGSGT